MTTKEAAEMYLAQHLKTQEGSSNVVYNPKGLPVEELPIIYGFNNGGGDPFWRALAISEDGHELSGHFCSNEGYMRADLGIIVGGADDKHKEDYQPHYPNGYRMEFVSYKDVPFHEGLQKAIKTGRGE